MIQRKLKFQLKLGLSLCSLGLLFVLFICPKTTVDKTLKTSPFLPCYTGCPDQYGSTAFYDFKAQECWSCPKGYSPTLEGVYSRRACKQYQYGLYADARRLGKLACGESLIAFR